MHSLYYAVSLNNSESSSESSELCSHFSTHIFAPSTWEIVICSSSCVPYYSVVKYYSTSENMLMHMTIRHSQCMGALELVQYIDLHMFTQASVNVAVDELL